MFGPSGGKIVNSIEDVSQARAPVPRHVVGNVPGLEGRQLIPWGTASVDASAGSCESAQNELISRKSQVFRDSFHIAEANILFD